jgi:signal transduction histidine kinase
VDFIRIEQELIDEHGRTLTLILLSTLQPIDEANTVIFRVLPLALLISLALAVIVSLIYAKIITAPVKAISKATLNMRSLEKDAECDVASSDEIGELAENINELYSRLLSTINDLQNEIQNVAAADKEKIDFMLTVSHELKTPLTSIKGMLEGMIYNVGVYKDRDKYLIKCGENIDALTSLLNEILETSKLELSPSSKDFTDMNVTEFVKSITATYEMIALSKQVEIDFDIDENLNCSLPAQIFGKALSNVISNAIKHGNLGGTVSVYNTENTLIIENPCEVKEIQPGLGLYLIERILKVCGLCYEFIPFEKGMRFKIFLK